MDVPHVVVFMLDCGCVNKTASREEVLCQFRRDGTSMSTSRNDCSLPSCLMTSLQACCEGNNIFLAARTSSKINPFKITQGSFVWWKLGAVTKFLHWFDSETLKFSGPIESSSLSTLYLHFQTTQKTTYIYEVDYNLFILTNIGFLYFGRQSYFSYIWVQFTWKSCLQENIVQDPGVKRDSVVTDKMKWMFVPGLRFLPTLVSGVKKLSYLPCYSSYATS